MLGTQLIGRAFARALRQELQYAKTATETGKTSAKTIQADRITGMSLQEAKQILNLSDNDMYDHEKLNKQYQYLFNLNDKAKGGSFYLQSKIYRAKERIDEELKRSSSSSNENSSTTHSTSNNDNNNNNNNNKTGDGSNNTSSN